jgi:hypothetical protein
MPTWGWILIAVVVLVAVIAALASRSMLSRKRTDRLKGHFGPEYDRALDETGEQRAAENQLLERERKRKKLDIKPLPDAAREQYAAQWRAVQTAFVDDPSGAVGDADALVTKVLRDRGYPVDDFDERASDISVDHPDVVENYRRAHRIYLAGQDGIGDTENQREALVHYRALFERLLEPEADERSSEVDDRNRDDRSRDVDGSTAHETTIKEARA